MRSSFFGAGGGTLNPAEPRLGNKLLEPKSNRFFSGNLKWFLTHPSASK